MTHTLALTDLQPIITLNTPHGFNGLVILSAIQTEGEYRTASIHMKLFSDDTVFNARLNRIHGTDRLHTYDLLEATRQIPSLRSTVFRTLQLRVVESEEDSPFRIELEIEYGSTDGQALSSTSSVL
jgi:hypothetical protein